MKRVLLLFFAVPLFSLPQIEVDLEGGALYAKPFNANVVYALADPNVQTLRPSYDAGWTLRARMGSELGDYIGGGYATVDVTTLAIARGNLSVPFLNLIDQARVACKQRIEYQTADLHFGHIFFCPKNAVLYGIGGGRYFGIRGSVTIQADSDRYRRILRFRGGGPEIGFGLRSRECWGFSAFGEVRFLAAIGKRETSQRFVDIDSQTICVPVIYFKMGGNLKLCIGPLRLQGSVGYFLDYAFQLDKRDRFPIPGARNFITILNDLGIGGLFATIKVGF